VFLAVDRESGQEFAIKAFKKEHVKTISNGRVKRILLLAHSLTMLCLSLIKIDKHSDRERASKKSRPLKNYQNTGGSRDKRLRLLHFGIIIWQTAQRATSRAKWQALGFGHHQEAHGGYS
jgi:hypothetical protein